MPRIQLLHCICTKHTHTSMATIVEWMNEHRRLRSPLENSARVVGRHCQTLTLTASFQFDSITGERQQQQQHSGNSPFFADYLGQFPLARYCCCFFFCCCLRPVVLLPDGGGAPFLLPSSVQARRFAILTCDLSALRDTQSFSHSDRQTLRQSLTEVDGRRICTRLAH